jgi:ATP-dependent Clp protease ATP-binding subunit ClpC
MDKPAAEESPISTNYLKWHFLDVPDAIARKVVNFLVFLWHFFSVASLVRTFFAPWKRQYIKKERPGINLQEIFQVVTFNLISRGVGAIARLFLIAFWLLLTLASLPLGLIVFTLWFIIPGLTLPIFLILKETGDDAQDILSSRPLEFKKVLSQLIQNSMGKFVFERLSIYPPDLENLTLPETEKNNFDASLNSFFKEGEIEFKQATIKDVFQALVEKVPSFKQFLEKKGATPTDLLSVCNWYLRESNLAKRAAAFFSRENLLKIPPIGQGLAFGYTPTLDKYSTDLTLPQPFFHHLVGREKEVTQMEQVLSRSTGNNVLLIGEPGTGRHTIILEFAKKIQEGRVHPSLAHKRILDLELRRILAEGKTSMVAKGVLEDILTEAAYAGNIVLVIDSFDQYVSTGPGRIDLTNVFSKTVSAGLQIIGITTPQDFAKYFYPNQELLKNFEKVEASPPSSEEALVILEDTLSLYEKRNQVFVTYQALKEIIDKVDKYIVDIPFPEKAIDLLDETCVATSQKGLKIITPEQVTLVISEKTKIPLGEIREEEAEKLKNLEVVIHQRIINQQEAVEAIAKALRRARVGITKSNKPIGTFLFMGPTGVGKTETAKALAEGYFGDDQRMIRFDMSEYQGEESLERVIGSVKTGEPGMFAKEIRENPFSLLLLDEIEKAHREILNLFLAMLDEGYFTDAFGKKVDCRNLIIIGTSNAGTELIREKMKEGGADEVLEAQVIDFVQRKGIFSPEFINRFDAVVIYRPLSPDNLAKVAQLMLTNLNKRLTEKKISIKITNQLVKRLVELGYDPAFGARPMNRVIQDKIEDKIAQGLLRGEIKKGQEIEINL